MLAILDRDRRPVFADRFRRHDWSIQLQRIKAGLEKYGNPDLYVDSNGAGQPIYEQLRSENVNAFGYTFTRQSKDALINNLALLFEQKKIVIRKPDTWPEGIEELEEFLRWHRSERPQPLVRTADRRRRPRLRGRSRPGGPSDLGQRRWRPVPAGSGR